MSTQLVKFNAPKALTVPPEAADAVKEAFAVNIAGGSVSEFDLPRIKVMSGAALWLIPDARRRGDRAAGRRRDRLLPRHPHLLPEQGGRQCSAAVLVGRWLDRSRYSRRRLRRVSPCQVGQRGRRDGPGL